MHATRKTVVLRASNCIADVIIFLWREWCDSYRNLCSLHQYTRNFSEITTWSPWTWKTEYVVSLRTSYSTHSSKIIASVKGMFPDLLISFRGNVRWLAPDVASCKFFIYPYLNQDCILIDPKLLTPACIYLFLSLPASLHSNSFLSLSPTSILFTCRKYLYWFLSSHSKIDSTPVTPLPADSSSRMAQFLFSSYSPY